MAQEPKKLTPHASAWHLLGAELRHRRLRSKKSQDTLGEEINFHGSYIGHAETAVNPPSRDLVESCDSVLGADGVLVRLWDFANATTPRQQDKSVVSPYPNQDDPRVTVQKVGFEHEDRSEVYRRELLHSMLLGAAVPLADKLAAIDGVRRRMETTLQSSTVGAATLQHWEQTIWHRGEEVDFQPPLHLLADVILDFDEVRHLSETRQPTDIQQGLCRAAAYLAGIAGALFIDLGDVRQSRAWMHTASVAAHESGDRYVQAWLASHQASLSLYYGTPTETISIARRGQELLGQQHGVLAVVLPALEARALAATANREAETAFGRAETAMATLAAEEQAYNMWSFGEYRLRFYEANMLTNLGHRQRAFAAGSRALELFPTGSTQDPALVRIDQAINLSRDGEPEEACQRVKNVLLTLPTNGGEQVIYDYAHRGFAALLPAQHRELPAARELREVLTTAASS